MKHYASLALIKFLSDLAKSLGVSRHVYVVGGAVRNFVMDPTGRKYPVKDIDVVIDSVALGKDSAWFAEQVTRAIPTETNLVTNNYGVALLHIVGDWFLGDENLKGEDIEIANARKESYGGAEGKGYKPHMVEPATIEEDISRREFTFNTLLWRLHDLADGPDKAEILDLTGCGLRDLEEGVMRCPTSPDKTFSDDPSRMVRAVKFLVKYGFRIDLEVERSIRKNRHKIKDIPHAHLSNMLINTFLREPTGKKALMEMERLGILEVVKEIAQEQKPFREALAGWADKEARVEFLFDLMDFGLPAGKRLSFLDPHQQARVREITVGLSHDAADAFVQILAQPGKAADIPSLMDEFGLKGPAVRQVMDIARRVLLTNPELAANRAQLTTHIRLELGGGKTAKTFTLEVGDPVLFGKYKNKPGTIKEFTTDEKSGDPVVVIEPYPKGRKEDKDLKLFKIRYDDQRAEREKAQESKEAALAPECRFDRADPSKKCEVPAEVLDELRLAYLGDVPPFRVWAVKAAVVRDEIDIDFTNGGNPAVYGYVPDGEIWIESLPSSKDMACTLLHELVETFLMQHLGLEYEDAHDLASKVEDPLRQSLSEIDSTAITSIAGTEYRKWLSRMTARQMAAAVASPTVVRRKLANPNLPNEYHAKLIELRAEVANAKKIGLTNSTNLWLAWFMFYKTGREWAGYVIDHLALPPKSAKPVEMAVRLFSKTYPRGKSPPDLVAWFEVNEARLELLDQARSWPERSEESGIFRVGPFTVHNTIQVSGKPLADAEDIITKAVRAATSVGIPGFAQMAYGDLFLVGQLGRKNWAAWYMPAKDNIYLRPGVKGSSNEESARHLVHELGHRFWAKKLDRKAKGEWVAHHTLMTVHRPDRRLPQVGEVLPTIVNNKRVRVEAYEQGGAYAILVEATSGDRVGRVDRFQLATWMQEADHRGKFPSLYAASDAEEHFCEALSLLAFDRLTGSNLDAFNKIVLGVEPTSVARVAARYKNKKKVKTEDGEERTVYEYSEQQVKLRHREKAKRIEELRGKLGDLRKQVKSDLKSEDPKTRLVALAVGLMNDTYERVGNDESAGEGHFGVTGWRVKHVTFGKGTATFKYVGKSGVKQEKETTDASLIAVLKEAVKGKGDNDCIFDYEDGKVRAPEVNEYLKDFDITAKDIRGLHANREMQKRLRAIRSKNGKLPEDKKEREKQLKDEFKEALEETAEAVGHEASTLKSQYLVPGLEDEFLKDGTVTEKMDKRGAVLLATKSDAEKEEEEAERLVRPSPPKKPPRDDLRRERMKEDDPDLDGRDDDLSLNFKKIANRLAERWFRHLVGADEAEHKPGDVWETDSGWRGMNSKKESETFDSKEKAEAFAKGAEDGGEAEEGKDPSKAVGAFADALASGSGKKIDQAKKTLLAEHPELKDDIERHYADFESASTDALRASVKAEQASDKKEKQKATKEAEAALERQQAAIEAIRGLGKKPEPGEKPDEAESEEADEPEADEPEAGDEPEEGKKPSPKPEPEDAEEKAKLDADIAEVVSALPDKTREKVEALLAGGDRAAIDKAVKAARKTLTDEIQSKGVTAAMMKAAEKDPLQGVDTSKPEEVARAIAQRMVQTQILHNPSNIGGKPLSETTLSEELLVDRAEAAFNQFQNVSAKTRATALKKAVDQLAELNPDSPQAQELNRIIDGIFLAAKVASKDGTEEDVTMTGPDGEVLRRPFSEAQTVLMKHLAKGKGVKVLLAARGEQIYEKEGRSAIRTAFEDMNDEDFAEVSKDQPWSPLAEALGRDDGGNFKIKDPQVRAFVRALAIDLAIDDMTTMQGLIAAAEGREEDSTSAKESAAKGARDAAAAASKGPLEDLIDCLLESDDPEAKAKCHEAGPEIRRSRFKAMWDWASKKLKGKLDPQNPSVARVRHVAEGGDFDALDQPVVPEAQALAEKKRNYLRHVTDPKERKRIQEMSPDDFKAMLAAIADEEEDPLGPGIRF